MVSWSWCMAQPETLGPCRDVLEIMPRRPTSDWDVYFVQGNGFGLYGDQDLKDNNNWCGAPIHLHRLTTRAIACDSPNPSPPRTRTTRLPRGCMSRASRAKVCSILRVLRHPHPSSSHSPVRRFRLQSLHDHDRRGSAQHRSTPHYLRRASRSRRTDDVRLGHIHRRDSPPTTHRPSHGGDGRDSSRRPRYTCPTCHPSTSMTSHFPLGYSRVRRKSS
ncbi:hypothetical protein V8D89_001177 [Ganoderma adspersum]